MTKNKTASAIAMLLILTIALTLVALPSAIAQSSYVYSKNTFAVVGAMPNPVGVGQEVLIWLGITDFLADPKDGWQGLTVTVTKPDNSTETLGPFRTDSTGSTGAVYVPTVVGTYYLQTHFPAQNFTWPNIARAPIVGNVLYKASSSPKLALTVQTDPVVYYPSSPLPTEYWTRPIDAQHREWSTISGNWLGALDYFTALRTIGWARPHAPHNQGPETSHMLWAKPLLTGGLAGGELGPHSYETGDAYEGFYVGSVIINGVLYYNQHKADGSTRVEQQVVAVELRTGRELWRRNWNNTRLAFGQVFYWDSFNYHGVFAYLWVTVGATWHAYDAFTGRWVYSMTNVPTSPLRARGDNGEIIIYTVDAGKGRMTMWNSSKVVESGRVGSDAGSWIRGDMGTTLDGNRGIQWNVTIPLGLPTGTPGAIDVRPEPPLKDRIIHWNLRQALVQQVGNDPIALWGISLKQGQEGRLLFNTTWMRPQADLTIIQGPQSLEDGVFTLRVKETGVWYGFSIDTGRQVWGPTEPEPALNIFGGGGAFAYGKFYTRGMGGELRAYDAKTGRLLWAYQAKDFYNEILWSNNWPINIEIITDGKIYLSHSEHSPVNPLPRGAPFICLDANTGKEIWRFDGLRGHEWGGGPIIGDGIIAMYNSYDQRIYAVGKGPTATTIVAPLAATPLGQSLLIVGTVMDQSAGTKEADLVARFPNGVPAVSDESMNDWMKHIYMQFPRPKNIVGVPVTIDVIDANGNYRNIGTVTSDASGFFSFDWQPDIPGKFTVIATFAGSKSYYPSSAHTAFAVSEAPAPPPEQPQLTLPPTEMYFVASTAAIIIAVAVIGLMLLKKRP